MSTLSLPAPETSVSVIENPDCAAPRDAARRLGEFSGTTANASSPDRAAPRDAARSLGEFNGATPDGEESPRATARDAAQPLVDSDFATANGATNGLRAAPRDAARRLGVFAEPAPPHNSLVVAEILPPENREEPHPLATLPAEPDKDAFPSYTGLPPTPGAVDFRTPWDDGIKPWTPPQEITEQQKTAIDLLLRGVKLDKIAGQLGIHRGTLWRWRRHDLDFRTALAGARSKAYQHSLEQLRELVPKAVDIVHSQLDTADHRAAFQLLRLVVNIHRDAMDPI